MVRMMVIHCKHEIMMNLITNFQCIGNEVECMQLRDNFIMEMFKRAVLSDQINYAMRLMLDYEAVISQ